MSIPPSAEESGAGSVGPATGKGAEGVWKDLQDGESPDGTSEKT